MVPLSVAGDVISEFKKKLNTFVRRHIRGEVNSIEATLTGGRLPHFACYSSVLALCAISIVMY
jgi:hypothetical protein